MIIARSVTVDRPVDVVSAYLSDFTTTTEWDPGTVLTTRESGDGGIGTNYRNRSRFLGRETSLLYVVTEFVPGERIVLRGENTTVVAQDTLTFSQTPSGGAAVNYRAEFTFHGMARLVAPLLAPAFKRLGDQAESGLRTRLEQL
jgi:uncharacterized protein YndB with AHSA1/START domain